MRYLSRFSSSAALLLMLGAAAGQAGERSAETQECKEITARIVERTNAQFDHFSPSGSGVFFKKPDLVLICDPNFVTYDVAANWDASGFPPNDWFALIAIAGNAVTGADPKDLEAAARRCHRAALRDKSELASIHPHNAKVECQAFTRDGGGVNVDIARR